MLTQLYTAPIKPVVSNAGPHGLHAQVAFQEEEQQEAPFSPPEQSQQESQDQPTRALQEQNSTGRISIQSVLTDFETTLEALDVPDDVRQQVSPYLHVVAHQAQQSTPSPALIKQNLQHASVTLDNYITESLGQPSTVVKEWVDALLLQPIEFKAADGVSVASHVPAGAPSQQLTGQSVPLSPSEPLSPKAISKADSERVKVGLHQAQHALKKKSYGEAYQQYQEVLSTLDGRDYPDVQGRVLFHMGRIMEKQGRADEALSHVNQADAALASGGDVRLQARVKQYQAHLLEQRGDLQGASQSLRNAAMLHGQAGNGHGEILALNQLGTMHIRLKDKDAAKTYLEQALEKSNTEHPELAGDILSNLGGLARQVGKHGRAFAYYKKAIAFDKAHCNTAGVRQTLQNVASLYLDVGKPEKAFQALQGSLVGLS